MTNLSHDRTLVQGLCFHLYTRQRSEALQDFQAAELQRTPLDELCLNVRPPSSLFAATSASGLSSPLHRPRAQMQGPAVVTLHDW